MKRICYLVGAGEHYGPLPVIEAEDCVIAVDGGYRFLLEQGCPVHLVLGDFDSLGEAPDVPGTLVLPKEKDDTDMVAAIREGMARGYRLFYLYGGTGGRIDHTLANIQCLADLAQKGARGFLYDRHSVLTAIHNDCASFPANATGILSVFAHSDAAKGVCETGLKYPLNNATLSNGYPLGVSNEFCGAESMVSVREGTLLLVYPKDVKEDAK